MYNCWGLSVQRWSMIVYAVCLVQLLRDTLFPERYVCALLLHCLSRIGECTPPGGLGSLPLALCPIKRTYFIEQMFAFSLFVCCVPCCFRGHCRYYITLEGVQRPRRGKPPNGGKKKENRANVRFSFLRRRSFGRRLSAPTIIRNERGPRYVMSEPPAPFGARAPPPVWYTGTGRPADGRRTHARRAHSLRGLCQTSPLEPVGSSATRAGDTHGGRATVATAQNMYLRQQKNRPLEW